MANERTVLCPICNTINNRLLTRECDTCKIPYHFKCVTPRLTRRLSNSLLVWSCPTCTGRGDLNQNHQIPDIELEQKLPQLIGEWKTNIKVLSRVPKGARVAAAEALATLMDDVTANNSTIAWARLLGFAFGALQCPAKTAVSNPNQPSLATKIRAQINAYMASPILPVATKSNDNPPKPTADNPLKNLSKRVAAKIADCDIRGAVQIISSDDTFAGFTDEVTAALQAKHPPAPAGLALPPPPDATTAPFQATKEQILEALRSFKPGSGAGPDGLRPGHLQSLTSKGSGAAGERLKNSITSLCNLICRGEVPEKVQPVF